MALALLATLASCGQSKVEEEKAAEHPVDQGPSIKDTVRFITNFASVFEPSISRNRAELSSSNACVVTFSDASDSGGWVIDFRSLNPDMVTVQDNPASVWVRTTNGEETITFRGSKLAPARFRFTNSNSSSGYALANVYFAMIAPYDAREGMKLDSISFYPRPGAEDRLPKVRDALIHLIRRCGGKKDLF